MPNIDMGEMGIYEPFAFETITVSTAAIGLTDATINPTASGGIQAKGAILTVEAATGEFMRVRMDGTDPTATVGAEVDDQNVIRILGLDALTKFRAIRDTGNAADVTVSAHYFR